MQHTPSTQFPLTQALFAPQDWPNTKRQIPSPSHACAASLHTFGPVVSGPAGVGEHVPSPLTSQALHAGHDGVAQHTPSTQLPLEHCSAAAHERPLSFVTTQVPLNVSQYRPAPQSAAVPHALHTMKAGSQKPLWQSELTRQGAKFTQGEHVPPPQS